MDYSVKVKEVVEGEGGGVQVVEKTGDIREVEEKGWKKKKALMKNNFLRKNHAPAQQLLA